MILKALGWVFVPFIMLPVQWKRLKRPAQVAGCAWALFFVVAMINGAMHPQQQDKPVVAHTASAPPTTSKPSSSKGPVVQTPELQIQNNVKNVFKDKQSRLENVEINSYLGDNQAYKNGFVVDVHFNADDAFSTNQSMKWTLMDVKDIAQAIFKQSKVEEAAFWVDADLSDQYGNTHHDLWFRVVLSGDDAYKINWDNILNQQFNALLQWQVGTPDARKAFDSAIGG